MTSPIVSPNSFSQDFGFSDHWTRRYAPLVASRMGWPQPIYCVTATDVAGIDVLCGSVGTDYKVHRKVYHPGGDESLGPEIVIEDKVRLCPGPADWQVHIWPIALPGTVVMLSQYEASLWLRRNCDGIQRLRHETVGGTVFWTPSFSLLRATLPQDTVLRVRLTLPDY